MARSTCRLSDCLAPPHTAGGLCPRPVLEAPPGPEVSGGLGASVAPLPRGRRGGSGRRGGPVHQCWTRRHSQVAEVVSRPQVETSFRETRGLLEEVVPMVFSRASHRGDPAVTSEAPAVSGADGSVLGHAAGAEATQTPLPPPRLDGLGQAGALGLKRRPSNRMQLAQFHECETTSVKNIERCTEHAWVIARASVL